MKKNFRLRASGRGLASSKGERAYTWEKRARGPWLVACGLLFLGVFTSCGKNELDPAGLTNNPFDPEYAGANVFVLDSTYMEWVTFPNGAFLYQTVSFKVKEELFLSPAEYNVNVFDEENSSGTLLNPSPANSTHFIYRRPDPVLDAPLCLRLSLNNNGSNARAERICATL